ncbi:MAG: NADH-quinone oxidoreductase subunit C [Gammaproteobacteria bacterium]
MLDQHEKLTHLATALREEFNGNIDSLTLINNELTIEVKEQQWHAMAHALVKNEAFAFEQLTDLCGVDYLHYGLNQWETEQATSTGFSRGVEETPTYDVKWTLPRFAVVYHLLSITHNWRLRVRVFLANDPPMIETVTDIWPCANWFEREAFDLFGILFNNHPDLRRILTDYGFMGYPFRKDFPLSGEVEVRYDPEQQRVIYQPVTIQPRTLVPRVVRHDNRYLHPSNEK